MCKLFCSVRVQHTWICITLRHACLQVVAGTNYDLVFTALLNCTLSDAPIILQAKVFQPLPYTNSPPQVSICSTAVRLYTLMFSMHYSAPHMLSGRSRHQLSSGEAVARMATAGCVTGTVCQCLQGPGAAVTINRGWDTVVADNWDSSAATCWP